MCEGCLYWWRYLNLDDSDTGACHSATWPSVALRSERESGRQANRDSDALLGETGAPPRSWEWCPSAARSAGLMSQAESKWEREHPRWPGNTTVYRYFDSWVSYWKPPDCRPSPATSAGCP
jgi:hypothetical protein